MIRIPVVYLRVGARPAVGFDFHIPLLPRPAVAVRTETRFMTPIAVLGVIRRLYGVDRDKIRPVRPGHVLGSPRQAPCQIGFDSPAFVTIDTEGLLMAIGAIVARLLGQQSMLLHKKGAVIAQGAFRLL